MRYKVLFTLIIFLAFLLRFYQLGKVPAALNIDEVSIGYNAYSVLKTGRDEFGKLIPLVFRSYDDFKPPLLIYLTIPSIAVFGLTDYAVRFLPAVLGVMTVVFTYLFTQVFLKKEKTALLAALLIAISPWHLNLTRTAFEVGAQSFFTITGLYLFFKKKNLLAALIFGLSMYLYQASKVFIPLLMVLLVVRYWRKSLIIFIIAFLIIQIPNVILNFQGGATRFYGTSVFQNGQSHDANTKFQITDWLNKDRFSAAILHPEILAYSQEILTGYLSHFRGDFLFLGRNGSYVNYFPPTGLLYLWEAPFLIYGAFNSPLILLAGILFAPVPAALTYGIPNPIRVAVMLPIISIVAAIGLAKTKKILALMAIPLCVYFMAFYLHLYYIHDAKDNSKAWYYGYKQAVELSQKYSNKYSKIYVSTALGQPHEFFLYYSLYDPSIYLDEGGTVSGGYNETKNHFAKYFFVPINWELQKNEASVLFIGKPSEFTSDAHILEKINYLNMEFAIVLVDKQ